MRIGWSTPKEAFCMLMGGKNGVAPALALDVKYELDEFGMPMLDRTPLFDRTDWSTWVTLPPRVGDLDKVIHTSKRVIRIPTIIVCSHFYLMPLKEQRPTPAAIRRRDGNRCQYTGVPLTNKTFSLDHVVPKSKGGKDSWLNLVAAHKDVNSQKGNRSNKEAGLKLLKKPTAPKAIPLCSYYEGIKHPDHNFF